MKRIEKYFNKATAEKLGKEEFCRQIDNANLVFMHQNGIKNAEQIWYALFPGYKEPKVVGGPPKAKAKKTKED